MGMQLPIELSQTLINTPLMRPPLSLHPSGLK